MTHVSRKLHTAWQGALAGGGDPATSPLYVFGPFLKLVVVAGVANITFGASIWLVIFTIATVSMMYRLVMRWITDGSGGSGLAEEEFGGWAVKINASITFIEYTLTFLVSIAALVTFAADRVHSLNQTYFILENRAWLAVSMSMFTAWMVNRGPRVAAKTFGPATGAILGLLWLLVFVTIFKRGFHLPNFDLTAFRPKYLRDTLGGFARILAVMTGIEVFANLVAAYDGTPERRSRKAFQSLMIIMGTTGVAMLIVGPAIRDLSDPYNEKVSVFTQTMDALLPKWVAEIGTLLGIAVLLSAAAASALGLQNLFVGLKLRHYVPPAFGQLNRFGVAGRPVILEASVASLLFVVIGTKEETYLTLYAAGVFILLSMTGWAATKRLVRELKSGANKKDHTKNVAVLIGTITASALTTAATIVIFYERFTEGAWLYFVLIPIIYIVFGLARKAIGPPTRSEERAAAVVAAGIGTDADYLLWETEAKHVFNSFLVPISGSDHSFTALAAAKSLADVLIADVSTVYVNDSRATPLEPEELEIIELKKSVSATIVETANKRDTDLIVISTGVDTRLKKIMGTIASDVVRRSSIPVMVLPRSWNPPEGKIHPAKILVTLDGSLGSERAIPYAINIAKAYKSEIVILHVPLNPSEDKFAREYATAIKESLSQHDLTITTIVDGLEPTADIPRIAANIHADLIIMATTTRRGIRKFVVGSVADAVIKKVEMPILLVAII